MDANTANIPTNVAKIHAQCWQMLKQIRLNLAKMHANILVNVAKIHANIPAHLIYAAMNAGSQFRLLAHGVRNVVEPKPYAIHGTP